MKNFKVILLISALIISGPWRIICAQNTTSGLDPYYDASGIPLAKAGLEDKKQGYIENTDVYFSITDGQTISSTADGSFQKRSMRRVDLVINGIKLIVQNSGDKELYVKGQNQAGQIVKFTENDYVTIRNAIKSFVKINSAHPASPLPEALNTALVLLESWPAPMPLLIWQNEERKIAAITENTIIATNLLSGIESIKMDVSILKNPDAVLQLPTIEPSAALQLREAPPDDMAHSQNISQAMGDLSSNTSISLCSKMGDSITGSYPIINYLGKISSRDSYKATVGGSKCRGRCGKGCTDSVTGFYGFGKNAYSQDCLDHDMCGAKRGLSNKACIIIFSDAANDFFSSPCKHDLMLNKVFVSNYSSATTPPSTLSAKLDLFVVFTIKNNANTRLPHHNVSIDVSVDNLLKKTLQLKRALNAYDSERYYYKIGEAHSYKAGKHSISIQIKSSSLIQTVRSNDAFKKSFDLQ